MFVNAVHFPSYKLKRPKNKNIYDGFCYMFMPLEGFLQQGMGRHSHFQLAEDQMQTIFEHSSYQIVASFVLGFHWMKIRSFFQRLI